MSSLFLRVPNASMNRPMRIPSSSTIVCPAKASTYLKEEGAQWIEPSAATKDGPLMRVYRFKRSQTTRIYATEGSFGPFRASTFRRSDSESFARSFGSRFLSTNYAVRKQPRSLQLQRSCGRSWRSSAAIRTSVRTWSIRPGLIRSMTFKLRRHPSPSYLTLTALATLILRLSPDSPNPIRAVRDKNPGRRQSFVALTSIGRTL